MWQAWVYGGGLTSFFLGLAWIAYRMHKDALTATQQGAREAIEAYRLMAENWRAAYEASETRATVREGQMSTLLGGTREPA